MAPTAASEVPYADIFVGQGEMADLMRRHDWAATPLGPPERWPESLKVALRLMLSSRFEMWLVEETYHTVSYSPLLGDSGKVEGMFCAVTEETDRVISERRLDSLRHLASALVGADTRARVLEAACGAMDRTTRDMPFSLLYLFDEAGQAHLHCAAGLEVGHRLAPPLLAADVGPWEQQRLLEDETSFVLPLPPHDDLPTGAWDRPATQVLVVALPSRGGAQPAGFLVAGVNPYRPLTDDYAAFMRLMAGQIAAGLTNADALEASAAERDRTRMLFRRAPSFMAVLRGPDHVFELVNESYQRLVGRSGLEGRAVREALPELIGQGLFERLG